jgi:hypothetical protein
MNDDDRHIHGEDTDLSEQVKYLTQKVKTLALNLAINLAKSKDDIKELTFMEKEFTQLIGGSVDVLKEVTQILNVYRNEGRMIYDPPSSSDKLDRIESSLNEILSLSHNILEVIASIKKKNNQLDKYK